MFSVDKLVNSSTTRIHVNPQFLYSYMPGKFLILHISMFWVLVLYRSSRKTCAKFQDVIFWVILSIKCSVSPACPIVNRYSSTSILLFKALCRVSSYEPASNLLPRRLTLPPPTPQYPCTVFVNTTLAIQLAVWLPRVGQQETEYYSHYYPNS